MAIRRPSAHAIERYRSALLLSLPALVGLAIFWYWPTIQAVFLGFQDYNLMSGSHAWTGFENYQTAATDPLLRLTFLNTVIYFLMEVPLQMALALALALLVQRGPAWLRTIILVPTVTSMVVVSVIWGLMYHPNSGLINSLLAGVGVPPQPFLTSAQQAMPSIALLMIWKNVGFSMLFFLAGLVSIPRNYYEAAATDGANSRQLLRYVTLPLLRGTVVFLLITNTVTAFKVFTPIFLITEGGPINATRVVVLYIFENAFRFNKMGYAAAISVLLALFLLIISVYSLRASRAR
ncbi:MAG: sugar ABC transporter permease [bacterium]|nr:sugar ABC transporter permease [bacterium]